MKLGDIFINLAVKGDTKPLKDALSGLNSAAIKSKLLAEYTKKLKNATTEEEKALVKSNFAQKIRNLRTVEGIRVLGGLAKQVLKVATVVTTAVIAFDRMANAVAKANQKIISFQRQTGISLSTLNKYASASASVNYNASPEATAQSLQNVANNLWDIRMGRGDISPYQELAFVGGKAINVWGKSVEQVIEELRESLKGVGDIQATNLITRMGFNADDLAMLRMTKEEFAQVKSLFLTSTEQKQLNKLSLELKKVHMELDLIYQKVVLSLMPYLIKIGQWVVKGAKLLYGFTQRLKNSKLEIIGLTAGVIGLAIALKNILIPAVMGLSKVLWLLIVKNPALLALIGALTTLFLLIDDYVTWQNGGQSYIDWGKQYNSNEDPNDPYYGIEKDQSEKPSWKNKLKAFGVYMLRGLASGGNPFMATADTGLHSNLLLPWGVSSPNVNNANVTQNNTMSIQTNQPADQIYNSMLPLTTDLKNIISENSFKRL